MAITVGLPLVSRIRRLSGWDLGNRAGPLPADRVLTVLPADSLQKQAGTAAIGGGMPRRRVGRRSSA
jgi:hypothetical protein